MPTYSCDMGKEAAIMATISLVLTVVNIICILITATVVLKASANFSPYLSIFASCEQLGFTLIQIDWRVLQFCQRT